MAFVEDSTIFNKVNPPTLDRRSGRVEIVVPSTATLYSCMNLHTSIHLQQVYM